MIEYEEEEENYEEDEEEEFEEDEYYNRKQDAEDYDDAQPAPIPAPKPKPSVESQQQQQKVQPSVLAKELSNKPATTSSTTPQGTLPDFVASAVQPRFDFSEPSPDDLVRAQHKQAFQPGKNKSVPQSQNKPGVFCGLLLLLCHFYVNSVFLCCFHSRAYNFSEYRKYKICKKSSSRKEAKTSSKPNTTPN